MPAGDEGPPATRAADLGFGAVDPRDVAGCGMWANNVPKSEVVGQDGWHCESTLDGTTPEHPGSPQATIAIPVGGLRVDPRMRGEQLSNLGVSAAETAFSITSTEIPIHDKHPQWPIATRSFASPCPHGWARRGGTTQRAGS